MGAKMWEAVPFIVMVGMEGCTIGLTILAKTAITHGLSPFVFVFYTNALASILLLPYSFIFHCSDRTEQPLFTFPLVLRFFLLGFTGICLSQNLAFQGLTYSSPIVVCAMGLLIPSISFILSIILRTTSFDWKSSSCRAKIIGTLISISGATMEELYKGPVVEKSSSSSLHFKQRLFVFTASTEHWVLGGLLLVAASLSVSIWNIIQLGTLKHYPQVMKVASFYSLLGTIQCALVTAYMERDPSAWKLELNKDLLLIVATAIFGGIIRSRVHIWCMRTKGPLYVPLFKPFGIVFATIFGVSFFADSFHYGSAIAAGICGVGYYTVMWGQIKEEEMRQDNGVKSSNISEDKLPLLQEEENSV